jgi:hypothetical protein
MFTLVRWWLSLAANVTGFMLAGTSVLMSSGWPGTALVIEYKVCQAKLLKLGQNYKCRWPIPPGLHKAKCACCTTKILTVCELISIQNTFCGIQIMQGKKVYTEQLFKSIQLSNLVPEDNFLSKAKRCPQSSVGLQGN